MSFPIKPPDGADWSIDVEPRPDGAVEVVILFDLGGRPTRLALGMDRPDVRLFARKLLGCAGDATERTFVAGGGDAVPR